MIPSLIYKKLSSSELLVLIFFAVCLLLSSIFVMNRIYIGTNFAILIVISPLILLALMNFKLSLSIEIIMLFIPMVVGFYTSVYFAYPLLIAFLLTHRNILRDDIRTPYNKIFIFYLISTIPSYIMSEDILFSLYQSINLLAFFIVFYSVFIFLNDYKEFIIYVKVFLLLVLLNSLTILFQSGISGKRNFGFAGIMFVDYVGIGIVISVVMAIFANKKWKLILLPCLAIFCIALILTQTRSIWITTAFTLTIFFIYLIFNSKKYSLKKSRVYAFLTVIILTFSLLSYYIIAGNQQILSRVQGKTDTTEEIQSGEVSNSLITRVFIWDTALNAFMNNPVTGTGIYTFPAVSGHYYTVPKLLYNKFVRSLTPHETFIAVASERGIIGLVGFVAFIIAMLLFAIKNIKLSLSPMQKKYSLVLLFANIYVITSMFITDAWLWGHGLILWSLVLTFTAVNRKIIIKENELIR